MEKASASALAETETEQDLMAQASLSRRNALNKYTEEGAWILLIARRVPKRQNQDHRDE